MATVPDAARNAEACRSQAIMKTTSKILDDPHAVEVRRTCHVDRPLSDKNIIEEVRVFQFLEAVILGQGIDRELLSMKYPPDHAMDT